jgi:H+/Cl- antiporter ClcA
MGASAITGGIARMTISLTVMVLEGTGDMQVSILELILTILMKPTNVREAVCHVSK